MEQNKFMKCLDLSDHDRKVLDTIFNPYQIGGDPVSSEIDVESFTVSDSDVEQQVNVDNCTIEQWSEEVVRKELEAIQETELKNFSRAIEIFDGLVELAGQKASIYNNRGQTYRLMGNDEAALEDINRALSLSNNTGSVACNAFCQRGILKRKSGDDDEARSDFNMAAKLGSKFARTQLVELNPYAALCNQMLKETFQKLS